MTRVINVGPLTITPMDEKNVAQSHNLYNVTGFNSETNPSDPYTLSYGSPATHTTVLFQGGDPKVNGVNGITMEALIAIAIDRLEGFQSGPFRDDFNQRALDHLNLAIKALDERTNHMVSK